MSPNLIQDNLSLLPEVNTTSIGLRGSSHPITRTLLVQLSQDLLGVTRRSGDSVDLVEFDRSFRPFKPWVQEALYQAMLTGEDRYLVLDFGDPIEEWDMPPDAVEPAPHSLQSQVPTIELILSKQILISGTELDEARYLKIVNPYPFPIGKTLDQELATHDRITNGIMNNVVSPGTLLFGITGLWQKLMAGGQAVANLTTRLQQTKRAMVSGGVLAYNLADEQPGMLPKPYHREHESLSIVESRISAITGIPSFVIWGHTDGDGYGVATSLELYSQRLGAMASRYLVPVLDQLAALLDPNDITPVWFEVVDLYPEKQTQKTDRLEATVSALVALTSIGAMNAIEVRNTIASQFDLVLDENPVITTENP